VLSGILHVRWVRTQRNGFRASETTGDFGSPATNLTTECILHECPGHYIIPADALAAPNRSGANERIGIRWAGAGRRSHQMINDLKGTRSLPGESRVVAVSDAWPKKCHDYLKSYEENVLRPSGGKTEAKYGIYRDYREMLDSKDIDAVVLIVRHEQTPRGGTRVAMVRARDTGRTSFKQSCRILLTCKHDLGQPYDPATGKGKAPALQPFVNGTSLKAPCRSCVYYYQKETAR